MSYKTDYKEMAIKKLEEQLKWLYMSNVSYIEIPYEYFYYGEPSKNGDVYMVDLWNSYKFELGNLLSKKKISWTIKGKNIILYKK